jgi:hypothetical protein
MEAKGGEASLVIAPLAESSAEVSYEPLVSALWSRYAGPPSRVRGAG